MILSTLIYLFNSILHYVILMLPAGQPLNETFAYSLYSALGYAKSLDFLIPFDHLIIVLTIATTYGISLGFLKLGLLVYSKIRGA